MPGASRITPSFSSCWCENRYAPLGFRNAFPDYRQKNERKLVGEWLFACCAFPPPPPPSLCLCLSRALSPLSPSLPLSFLSLSFFFLSLLHSIITETYHLPHFCSDSCEIFCEKKQNNHILLHLHNCVRYTECLVRHMYDYKSAVREQSDNWTNQHNLPPVNDFKGVPNQRTGCWTNRHTERDDKQRTRGHLSNNLNKNSTENLLRTKAKSIHSRHSLIF